MNRASSALAAGSGATMVFYLLLFFVQIQNADNACESPEAAVPGVGAADIEGIGFENSFLNLGGRCTYYLEDGSVWVTREPGWWFSGTIAGFAAALAGAVALITRRKGHQGLLFGLATLAAPPLGLALALAAGARRTNARND